MGAYKQISPQDTFLTTYISHKEWFITGSQYDRYGVMYAELDKYSDKVYYPTSGDEYSGSYKQLYYKSLDLLYYRSFNNLDSEFSQIGIVSSSYEHYLQTSLIESNVRHIEDEVIMISIPRSITGTGIKPGSFTVETPVLDESDLYVDLGYILTGYFIEFLDGLDISEGVLTDSTEGSLIIRTSLGDYVRVGDINYLHGIIVITHPSLVAAYKISGNKPFLNFKSTKEIHTHNTHCTVMSEELNYTLNPTTIVSGSVGTVKQNYLIDEFNPYITTVGLYNQSNELLAVGKLSQPVPKSDQTDMVFVVKVGFDNKYDSSIVEEQEEVVPPPPPPTSFISTWETTNTSTGSSGANQVRLPLQSNGVYNFTVNWGDGNTDTITTFNQAETTHTYSTPGEYTITIDGTCQGFAFENTADRQKLISITSFGNVIFGNYFNGIFRGCINLDLSTVTDIPNLSTMNSLRGMFGGCTSLTTVNNMNSWSTSNIINLEQMFFGASSFNQPIGNWNVSNVTNMRSMFHSASSFNQDISNWNVSNVTNMISMFQIATIFNQPIGNWNVSNITNMSNMFLSASSFNQPIGNWNVSNVTNMGNMFLSASSFNQPIGNWNVSNVTNMRSMFASTSFNQDISNWNVSNVTNMGGMFASTPFNQNINMWNVSNVDKMDNMFSGTILFNQPLDNWNVSNVTDMRSMFSNSQFNQPIGNWNMSSVIRMDSMFQSATLFNQPIDDWDVSSVTNMFQMFASATDFNQPIGNWDVSNVTNMGGFMTNKTSANYSATNLDTIYNRWSLLTLQPNLTISFGTVKYTAAGQDGKNILTGAPNNWTITDGGVA
jgi:surface protein